MIDRVRKMLDLRQTSAPPTRPDAHEAPPPSAALAVEERRHEVLLSRGDRLIRAAMEHADEAFGPAPARDRRRS